MKDVGGCRSTQLFGRKSKHGNYGVGNRGGDYGENLIDEMLRHQLSAVWLVKKNCGLLPREFTWTCCYHTTPGLSPCSIMRSCKMEAKRVNKSGTTIYTEKKRCNWCTNGGFERRWTRRLGCPVVHWMDDAISCVITGHHRDELYAFIQLPKRLNGHDFSIDPFISYMLDI